VSSFIAIKYLNWPLIYSTATSHLVRYIDLHGSEGIFLYGFPKLRVSLPVQGISRLLCFSNDFLFERLSSHITSIDLYWLYAEVKPRKLITNIERFLAERVYNARILHRPGNREVINDSKDGVPFAKRILAIYVSTPPRIQSGIAYTINKSR